MKDDLKEIISPLKSEFKRYQNTENGLAMSKYMKDRFPFYGIKADPRRAIYKNWIKSIPKDLTTEEKWMLIQLLWHENEREFQHSAIDWMNSWPAKDLKVEDGKYIEYYLITKSWWDSVDSIASNFLSKYISKFPVEGAELINKWRRSNDFWLNRTCLIFQLKYGNRTDFDLLKDLIIQFNPNREFFIQKAIGWSLRQYSKFNPEAVRQFLSEQNIKGLALREASKYI